jgi:hypothetical protein
MSYLQEELETRVKQLEERLRQRLTAEDFRLVCQLRQAEEVAATAACQAWEAQFLDALVQHFPNIELAIRGVALHVMATSGDCETLRGQPSGRHGR